MSADMFSAALPLVGFLAALAASGLAFFAGFMWRSVAKASGQSTTFSDAARFTGAALICAGIAGFLLLGHSLG